MPRYLAQWNMPGERPYMEPEYFDTFEAAREFIVNELEHQHSENDCFEEREFICAVLEEIAEFDGPFSVANTTGYGGPVYSVTRED